MIEVNIDYRDTIFLNEGDIIYEYDYEYNVMWRGIIKELSTSDNMLYCNKLLSYSEYDGVEIFEKEYPNENFGLGLGFLKNNYVRGFKLRKLKR